MGKFIPRYISAYQAAQGYNNEGRGELLGYLAVPSEHEGTCRYRTSTGGDPNKQPHEACSCRLGLWRDKTVSEKVLNEMRKTSTRRKTPTTKVPAKPKPKAKSPKHRAIKRRKQ